MKNFLLAIAVVGTLVAGGIGGTFGHFSDTESSNGNFIQIGSMDLKVIDKLTGAMYDDPLPSALAISAIDVQPCESHDFTWQLKNSGQPEGDMCHVYMHVKNPKCESIPDKLGKPRPEPEVVAEDGGWLGQVYVPGMGKHGDTCNLPKFVEVTVYYPWDQDTGTGPTIYRGPLDGIVCKNLLLGELAKCNTKDVHVVVHFYDISEDDLGKLIGPDPYFKGVDNDKDGQIDEDPRDGIDNDGDGKVDEDPADETGHFDGTLDEIKVKCWDHWPTNAFMKDKVTFEIMFSLVQG